MNKGLEIVLIDERNKEDKVKKVFKSEGGICDYVKYLNRAKTVLYDEPLYFSTVRDGIVIEIAMQHTDGFNENIYSYVNNIPTIEGGMHDVGFKSGLTKVLSDYIKNNSNAKNKNISFVGDDFRVGLTAVLKIKMKNIQFEGQTKTKLGNIEAKVAVEGATYDELYNLTKGKNTAKCFEAIVQKAISAANERAAVRKTKELQRAKSGADSMKLLGKLANCSSKDSSKNEIFIVEGDSAGGSAKSGRDRAHQAILPLRGKPLNCEKKSLLEVLKNEEFKVIIAALGTGIGADFNIEDLNYDKVIILSDADQDGYHIRAILLTFFFRYMRELITGGHVYIGMPPLYKVYKNDVVEYAYDEDERQEKLKLVGRNAQTQRYKGLGEMNPSQLWETTLNPDSRVLTKVTIEEAAEADELVATLMGDDSEPRKLYISKHASFNKIDDFNTDSKEN